MAPTLPRDSQRLSKRSGLALPEASADDESSSNSSRTRTAADDTKNSAGALSTRQGGGDLPESRLRFALRPAGDEGRIDHFLKVRKRLFGSVAVYKIGLDLNLRSGELLFRSSCKDRLIGGKLTMQNAELRWTKTWRLESLRLICGGTLHCISGQSSLFLHVSVRGQSRGSANLPGFYCSTELPPRSRWHKARGTQLQLKGSIELPEASYVVSTGDWRAHYSEIVAHLREASLIVRLD